MEQIMRGGFPWSEGGQVFRSPYLELAAGIIGSAIKDYIKTLEELHGFRKSRRGEKGLLFEKASIERFFYSSWFEMLSDLDPDTLVRKCQEKALRTNLESGRCTM